jgi:hypothetical protein
MVRRYALFHQPSRGVDQRACWLVCQHQTLPWNDQSPPDRKRPRRTPNPAEQQQRQPPRQQPELPMAHIESLPPGSMLRPATIGGGQPLLNGFGGPQMGMAPMTPMYAMSPNTIHGPPAGVMNSQMSLSQVLSSPSPRISSNTLVAKPDVAVCATTGKK